MAEADSNRALLASGQQSAIAEAYRQMNLLFADVRTHSFRYLF